MAKKGGAVPNKRSGGKPWQDDRVSRVTPRVTPEKTPTVIPPDRKGDGTKQ